MTHSVIVLDGLDSVRWELVHPISVQLDLDGSELLITIPEVELWATASDREQAIAAARMAVVGLCDDLLGPKRHPEGLGKLPQRWRRWLRIRVRPVTAPEVSP